ncbi:hypothetical protein [Streptomyces sp. NPDC057199]|uniref:hypothetical protein n=1 Tax=Streptomyces sp. NPDC057199 TaxID=3346047 RepID=UPI0036381635
MPPSADQSTRKEILEAHRAYLDALADGNTKALLDDLLNDGFTRTSQDRQGAA